MSRAEELRDNILWKEHVPVVCDYQSPAGEVHQRTWQQATKADLDSLILAARAEGAAEERKRIRASADLVREGHYADASAYFSKVMGKGEKLEVVADEDCFVIPVSALAPKEG
jgi:23S rRNA G2069 N7-methylase RlmK/C1962 C5-methylase RlmI